MSRKTATLLDAVDRAMVKRFEPKPEDKYAGPRGPGSAYAAQVQLMLALLEATFWLSLLGAAAAADAAGEGFRKARLAVYRHRAQVDRAFARHCSERLRDLKGASRAVYARALRELVLERERIEEERSAESFSDQNAAAAHRAAGRLRRETAWKRWFGALERDAAGRPVAPGPGKHPPGRRGAPVRRLCERSVCKPPSPQAILEQYEKARGRGRIEEKIRLGSMLLDIEATVDSSLIRNDEGEIVGRRGGLRQWIDEACPALARHYSTLTGYRRMAADFRREHGLSDPVPAALLLAEEPEIERKLPPAVRAMLPAARQRARKLLAEPDISTVRAFSGRLLAMRDARAAALGRRLRA